ncbi:TetR/AcrR family transcriptional regulator [Tistrella bauzanensis]
MPYRPTEATERRKAERRSLILKAAREQIAAEGFRGTRVRLVAARAGVSEGTIYRYFPSMTALFTELLRMSAMRELEVATRAATGPGPGADRLAAAVRIHLTRALKRPRLAHALLAEPVAPDVEAVRLACRKGFHEMFADVMDQAIAGGEYHPSIPRWPRPASPARSTRRSSGHSRPCPTAPPTIRSGSISWSGSAWPASPPSGAMPA